MNNIENVDILNKELEKKDLELKNLKDKNLIDKILSSMRILMVLGFLTLEVFIGVYLLQKYGIIDDTESKVNEKPINVAILDINKQLTMEYVNSLIEKMEDFKDDETIKEVLIVMNCPGGSPVAADEFTEYIKDFNKNKKINMYVQTMAASGGYYIASAIKPIVANKNAIVGSIGVIMPKYTIKKLADKVGVEEDNVVVGEYKVPVTYFENVTKEQEKYLKENMLMPTYENFIGVVAENRGIEVKELEKYAQGKIFIANKSLIKNILVDDIQNLTSFKIAIKDRISKDLNIDSNNIGFIQENEKESKLGLFKINLDLNNLIESDKILLK